MEKHVKPTRIFIHGLESSGQGTKGAFFKGMYPDMIVEDFFGTFDERMAKLNTILAGKNDMIIVGSSYGGLMASVFACRTKKKIRKLILLAPALNHMSSKKCRLVKLCFPVIIYHGSQDKVVPPGPVYEFARTLFTNLTWHLVDDDHFLHKTFLGLDWENLLS
jgi:predicted alpha/beta hydrolase family esterase